MKIQQSDAKETKQFWNKIWKQKEHNRMAEWINNFKKDIQKLEESPRGGLTKTNTQESIKLENTTS